MALYMWMEGVPGRPGWDGWFEINSFHFNSGNKDARYGGLNAGRSANVSKGIDGSSAAILRLSLYGKPGPASVWSGEDTSHLQLDMEGALVTAYHHNGAVEHFEVSFTKVTYTYDPGP